MSVTGRKPPTSQNLLSHRAVVQNVNDAIWSPLYDYQTYAAAGQLSLQFFSTPVGQGATSHPGGAGVKTLADTNLTNAGMLPKGNALYCVGLEIVYFPTTLPARGGIAAAAVGHFVNDVYVISRSGWAQFRVQNRDIALDAPLMTMPGSFRLGGFAAVADATTAAASLASEITYAQPQGAVYEINPVTLESNQAFSVTLNWPNVIATTSTATVRIGVRLLGNLIRKAQ
jgi:hypothetical protein